MQLQALRPKQGANLVQLQTLLEGRGWRSALPTSIPDAVLLHLARDFRQVEAGFAPHAVPADEDSASLAAAMYVVMNLLIDHPARRGGGSGFDLSEPALMRMLQLYQVGLEREIVTRITGLASSTDVEALADELVRCADEH
jgi:hypothetical protein